MTERSDTASFGGSGGSASGRRFCPDGAVVNKISGASGEYVDQLCMSCNDGTPLGCIGQPNDAVPYGYDGPFNSIYIRYWDLVDNILGSGGGGGREDTATCPPGKYVVGYEGRGAKFVDNVKFICGVDKNQYCVNNLETDLCRNISKDVLNKACAINMSDTCKNRKDELDPRMVEKYCETHKEDPFCSCYINVPDYIPAEIRGLTKCWNKKCADYGYIPPSLRGTCPNITICRQNLGVDGGSNMLTGNVIVQDCSTTVKPTPDPGTNTGVNTGVDTGVNVPVDTPVAEDKPASVSVNTLLIIFLIIMVLYLSFGDDSPPQYTYGNR